MPPWSQTLPPIDREPDASTSVERSSPLASVSVTHWKTNSMTVLPARVALCAIPGAVRGVGVDVSQAVEVDM